MYSVLCVKFGEQKCYHYAAWYKYGVTHVESIVGGDSCTSDYLYKDQFFIGKNFSNHEGIAEAFGKFRFFEWKILDDKNWQLVAKVRKSVQRAWDFDWIFFLKFLNNDV